MSAESDAIMKQLRQAVYERLVGTRNGSQVSLEGSIGQRSIAFRDWLVTVRKTKESEALSPNFVRHWAVADMTAWRAMPSDRHALVADNIFQNISANVSYAETLQKIDSEMVDRVKALSAENDRKPVEKEEQTPRQLENRDATAQSSPTYAPVVAPIAETQSPVADEADGFAGEAKDGDADNKPFDPELAISKMLENVTYKAQKDGSVLYMVSERPAFIDYGQQIVMASKANEDEEAILAAILLAKEKYGGSFELTGSEAFQRHAIKIMLKYEVDVNLKSPQQDALRRELAKAKDDAPKQPEVQEGNGPKPLIGKQANDDQDTQNAPLTVLSSDVPNEDASVSHLAANLIPVRALDWWSVQREAIQVWAKSDDELKADLEQLGQEPSSNLIYWFDKDGEPCDPPTDADVYLANLKTEPAGFVSSSESELRMRDAMSEEVSAKLSNNEVTAMSDEKHNNQGYASKENEPKLILRGVRKLDNGEYDTSVLLFKGNGDYLQGFIKVGNEKHQVIAHINERKNVDLESGEIKPNFLKLVEAHSNGDDTEWKQLGFGNAVNRRSDEKPVYFDEVLFKVGNEIINARITKNVDDELHRKLGFQEKRQSRQKDDDQSSKTPSNVIDSQEKPQAHQKDDGQSGNTPSNVVHSQKKPQARQKDDGQNGNTPSNVVHSQKKPQAHQSGNTPRGASPALMSSESKAYLRARAKA
ncbi:LPD7 domain-containing protein [Xylella fastidiosa]|uniref:LPD7 domain-containing protein n=1 Tax=Xylella fastidiosa TaxID=2371 RepID=UPI001E3DB617|nr:LPD7 domain-containing protein [Xylella fastidiosa]